MYMIKCYYESGKTVDGPAFKTLFAANQEAQKRNNSLLANPSLACWAVAIKE